MTTAVGLTSLTLNGFSRAILLILFDEDILATHSRRESHKLALSLLWRHVRRRSVSVTLHCLWPDGDGRLIRGSRGLAQFGKAEVLITTFPGLMSR